MSTWPNHHGNPAWEIVEKTENFEISSILEILAQIWIFQNPADFERIFFKNVKKIKKSVSNIFLYLSKAAENRCRWGCATTATLREKLLKTAQNPIFPVWAPVSQTWPVYGILADPECFFSEIWKKKLKNNSNNFLCL